MKARIVWYDEYEQEQEIYTSNPQGFTDSLRKAGLMFVVFPGNCAIPRNKK